MLCTQRCRLAAEMGSLSEFCTASIAAFVSAAPMLGTRASSSPVAGFTTANFLPDAASAHWPWMKPEIVVSSLESIIAVMYGLHVFRQIQEWPQRKLGRKPGRKPG